MKKIIIVTVLLLAAALTASAILLRKLPDLTVSFLEKCLQKGVSLQEVDYHFPGKIKIKNLAVNELGRFKDENSLYVEKLTATFELRRLLFERKLVIPELTVIHPQITVRRMKRVYYHALSGKKEMKAEEQSRAGNAKGRSGGIPLPVEIERVTVEAGAVQVIDYDASEKGFAMQLHGLEAAVRQLSTTRAHVPAQFELKGFLAQGRSQPPAEITASGSHRFLNKDTDMNLNVTGIWLPYFEPYYRKVTASRLQDGVADIRSKTMIEHKGLITNARMDFRRLRFLEVEAGGRVLGLDADFFLNFLKNQAGRISLDVQLRWDLEDNQMTFEKVLRSGMKASFESALVQGLGNVVSGTLGLIAEEGADFVKKDWKNIIKKDAVEDVVGKILGAGTEKTAAGQ